MSHAVHAAPPALAGPLRLRKPCSSFLRATPAGAFDTDVFFPCRPSDAEPLTIRRPAIRHALRQRSPGCRGSRPVTVSRDLDWLLAAPVKDPRDHQSGPPSAAVADPHQVGVGLEAFASLPATELALGHPDPVPGATPVRFGSRRRFTRTGPPPLGGAPSPARSTRTTRCLPSRAPGPDDARRHLQLSRPTDAAASPDPRRTCSLRPRGLRPPPIRARHPAQRGRDRATADQGHGASPLP